MNDRKKGIGDSPLYKFLLDLRNFFIIFPIRPFPCNINIGDNNMARKPRLFSEHQLYHIILRGNNKQNIFSQDDDYLFFLNRVKKYTFQLKIEIYAYCLMGNHVHLLIGKVSNHNLSLFVQKLANSYVYYFNHKYDCSGHLFQGRFKSEAIEDINYLKNVLRYIIHNPEKAGICKYNQYMWNSYNLYTSKNSEENIGYCNIKNLFHSNKEFEEFLSIEDKQEYMEYENKFILTDMKAINLIKKIFHIDNPYSLNKLYISKQNPNLNILKKYGISKNQLSRITGIRKHLLKFY